MAADNTIKIVVLDTNVLMKSAVFGLAAKVSGPNSFRLCWPQRVEDSALKHTLEKRSEVLHGVLEKNLDLIDDRIIDNTDHLANRFTKTDVEDVHVATAAAGAGASILVTDNLKDFDVEELLAFGVVLHSIDDFGAWMFANYEKRFIRSFELNPPDRLENYLNILASEMPDVIEKVRPYFAKELAKANPLLTFDQP